MTSLADVDEYKLFIQVCVWLRFPHLISGIPNYLSERLTLRYQKPRRSVHIFHDR